MDFVAVGTVVEQVKRRWRSVGIAVAAGRSFAAAVE